jgi:hypothetical protein
MIFTRCTPANSGKRSEEENNSSGRERIRTDRDNDKLVPKITGGLDKDQDTGVRKAPGKEK